MGVVEIAYFSVERPNLPEVKKVGALFLVSVARRTFSQCKIHTLVITTIRMTQQEPQGGGSSNYKY